MTTPGMSPRPRMNRISMILIEASPKLRFTTDHGRHLGTGRSSEIRSKRINNLLDLDVRQPSDGMIDDEICRHRNLLVRCGHERIGHDLGKVQARGPTSPLAVLMGKGQFDTSIIFLIGGSVDATGNGR